MQNSWSAEYFAKGSSKATRCKISVLGYEVTVEVASETLRYQIKDISVSDRLGKIPRKVRLPDDGLVKIEDHPDIDAAFDTHELNTWIHWLESHMHAVIFSVVALVAFSLFFYFVFLPQSAKYIASVTPQFVKEKIDQSLIHSLETMTVIDKGRQPLEDYENYRAFVKQHQSRYPNLHLKFDVVDDPTLGPNAFALAGGTIMVTKQLMDLVKEPDMVDAIMLHEIGHIEHNHLLQGLIQRVGLSLFLFMIIGADDISALPLIVMSNAYSRDLEREADFFAANAMLAEGRDPALLAEALTRITELENVTEIPNSQAEKSKDQDEAIDDASGEKADPQAKKDQPPGSLDRIFNKDSRKTVESFLSTHPLTDERIEYLQTFSKGKSQ
jgi:Zn-dependent protease with chaperone function